MLINFCINHKNFENWQIPNLFETNPFCFAAATPRAVGAAVQTAGQEPRGGHITAWGCRAWRCAHLGHAQTLGFQQQKKNISVCCQSRTKVVSQAVPVSRAAALPAHAGRSPPARLAPRAQLTSRGLLQAVPGPSTSVWGCRVWGHGGEVKGEAGSQGCELDGPQPLWLLVASPGLSLAASRKQGG